MSLFYFFFFQAEDGIRGLYVTGVQTCALPICTRLLGGVNGTHLAGGGLHIGGAHSGVRVSINTAVVAVRDIAGHLPPDYMADGSVSVGGMAERLGIADDRGRMELTRLLRYLWWNNALTWLPPSGRGD